MTNTIEHNALVDAAANDLARGIPLHSTVSSFQRLMTIQMMPMGDIEEHSYIYDINNPLEGIKE